MDFASDNVGGASSPIIEELARAARAGAEGTYGNDRWSRQAARMLEDVFEHELSVSFVATGTAANALALAALCPPWGAVFCHVHAHVNEDESGAPEFYTAGAKLAGVPGAGGKMTPDALRGVLRRFPRGVVRQVQPAALSLSQATESGTVYTVAEIEALTGLARDAGLPVHMDGARFANALVTLGCTPAAMTWKAGVDVLSFGASKNGALACEAVIFFDPARAEHAAVQRKRAGHILSKGRLLGAQMTAYLDGGHWLDLARQANATATRLATGLAALPGVRLAWPRQANEIFAVLPRALHRALHEAGAHYYEWDPEGLDSAERPGADEVLVRLICSFESTGAQVDALLGAAREALAVATSP